MRWFRGAFSLFARGSTHSPRVAHIEMPSFAENLGRLFRSGCAAESCSGQPPACPTPVSLGSSRPENEAHRQRFHLRFLNAAAAPVILSWLAANGTVGAVIGVLQPGERIARTTTTGDAFVATLDSGPATLLMQHIVAPVVVRACECQDAPLVLCPPRTPSKHNASARPTYEPAGFLNYADAPVDVYMRSGACEHLLTTTGPIAPRGQAHYAAWAEQRFRVRRHEGGQLLLEHVVGEIIIRPCTAEGRGEDKKDVELRLLREQVSKLSAAHVAVHREVRMLREVVTRQVSELQADVRRMHATTWEPTRRPSPDTGSDEDLAEMHAPERWQQAYVAATATGNGPEADAPAVEQSPSGPVAEHNGAMRGIGGDSPADGHTGWDVDVGGALAGVDAQHQGNVGVQLQAGAPSASNDVSLEGEAVQRLHVNAQGETVPVADS